MTTIEIILFIAIFFLIAILWLNMKITSKESETNSKWLAHIELLLKSKGIWDYKDKEKDNSNK